MRSGSVHRSGLLLAMGGGLGALVALALTPVITRIYEPETFGVFVQVVALASTLIGFNTLRYEIIGQTEEQEEGFSASIRLALANALAVAVITSAVSAVFVFGFGAAAIWILVGPISFIGSATSIGAATFSRQRKYGQLSLGNFLQQGIVPAFQAGLGLYSASVLSLVVGFMLGRGVWFRAIFRALRGPSLPIVDVHRRRWRSATSAGFSALVNSAGSQVLLLGMSLAYGAAVVGIVGMAIRLVVGPLSIVSQAVGQVIIGNVGKLVRSRENESLIGTLVKTALVQAALAVVPCALIVAFGPKLVPIILGREWSDAGIACAILAFGAYAQFVGAPFAQVLNLLGKSSALLLWDVVRVFLLASSVIVPWVLGEGWEVALMAYSAAQFLTYGLLFLTIRRSVQSLEVADR